MHMPYATCTCTCTCGRQTETDRQTDTLEHSSNYTHRFIHDAAGKVFVDNKNLGVMGRDWTISSIQEHYDYNAATMLAPQNENFNFDFKFNNYIHVYYEEKDFIRLDADAVVGIRSWRFTEGGTSARAIARGGAGGGLGYNFRSRPHICFCKGTPCPHSTFTGEPSEHSVLPCTQDKADRQQATEFLDTIEVDTPLASKGDLDDSTSDNEPLWCLQGCGKCWHLEIACRCWCSLQGDGDGGRRHLVAAYGAGQAQGLRLRCRFPCASGGLGRCALP